MTAGVPARADVPPPARRRAARSCVLLTAAVVMSLLWAAHAAHAAKAAHAAPSRGPAAQLTASVSGSLAAPVLVLVNGSDTACQVAAMTTGLVQFVSVQQDAAEVVPRQSATFLADRIDRLAAARLTTLEPGERLALPLDVPAGPDMGLVAVSAAPDGSATELAYRLDPSRPTRVAVQYLLPVLPPGEAPPCSHPDGGTAAPAQLSASSPERSGDDGPALWLVAGAVGAAAAGALAVAVLVRRRRRAGAAALLLLIALAAPGVQPPDANADYSPSAGTSAAFAECMAVFRAPGGDPAGLLGTLDRAQVVISGIDGGSYTTYGLGTVFINWNSSDTHEYVGGGNAEACSTLYHEMFHGSQLVNGVLNDANCWVPGAWGDLYDTGIRTSEVDAVRAQNLYRTSHGLPERATYGDTAIPSSPCQPPPDDADERSEMCREMGAGCGATNGDPHLTTFDGARYDFQAAGEFLLAADRRGGFAIQVRQEPVAGSTVVAVTTAAALDVAGDRVQVQIGAVPLVNGAPLSEPSTALPAGGRIEMAPGRRGPLATVTWPDGSAAQISDIGRYGQLVVVRPSPLRAGSLHGLLGDYDGDRADDVARADGEVVEEPYAFDELYPAFADSWGITPAGSLFDYAPGTTTESFAIREFPQRQAVLDDVPDPAAARAACAAAGVTDPRTMNDCVLDVGLTGRTEFADALAAASPRESTGAIAIDGPAARVDTGPGSPARLKFTAEAGQQVYVQASAPSLPSQCGMLELRSPAGAPLGGGCVIAGSGSIDRTVLPVDGEYALLVAPQRGSGEVEVRLSSSTTRTTAIALDGAAVVAEVATAGGEATLTFRGERGQRVFVEATNSTFAPDCGILALLDPSGRPLDSGCVIGGTGFLDATTLPATGGYTIVVDPDEAQTGRMTLRLTSVRDAIGALEAGGPAVAATVGQPGATASFEVDAAAGQVLRVAASGSTFPDQCSILQLLDAAAVLVALGCVVNGAGSMDPVTVPADGRYRVVVDPYGPATGTMQVRLLR
jgi:hypothetical protein